MHSVAFGSCSCLTVQICWDKSLRTAFGYDYVGRFDGGTCCGAGVVGHSTNCLYRNCPKNVIIEVDSRGEEREKDDDLYGEVQREDRRDKIVGS